MGLWSTLGRAALKTKPVGPNILEAAEQAGKKGLGPDVKPKVEVVEEASPKPLKDEQPEVLPREEGEAQPIPREEPEPRPEPEPATFDEAAEIAEATRKPRPLPEEQASNTNFERWNTQEEMEAMWDTAAKQIDENAGAGARMSHVEMIAKAEDAGYGNDVLGWMVRQLDEGKVDIGTLPGQVIIARETAVELSEWLFRQAEFIDDAAQTGKSIDEEVLFEFQKNISKFRMIQEVVGKYTRIAGQLLGSFNYVTKNQSRVRLAQVTEMIDEMGGAQTIIQKAQNIANLKNLSELSDDISKTFAQRAGDVVEAIRYNNMLSSFKTALRNFVGNLSHNAYMMATTATEAAVGSAQAAVRRVRGAAPSPQALVISDFVNGTRAMGHSFLESLVLSIKSWADPTIQIGNRGKLELRRTVTLKGNKQAEKLIEKFGLFGRGFVNMVDILGLSLGTRNLASGDVVFKNALWRFDTHMNAHQIARAEGLAGDALKTRITELLTNPRMAEDMFESGMSAAAIGTHTQQPSIGTFAQNFLNLRNTRGPINTLSGAGGTAMRLAVPFARVMVNLMTWSAKTASLPAHPLVNAELRQAVRAGTREGNEYLGRLGVYALLFNYIGYQTVNNNITGTGRYVDARTLRQWKEDGWQPMAWRTEMPDGRYKYRSFAQIQPFATLAGWMADTTDVVSYYSQADDIGAGDLIEGVATSLKVLAVGPFEAPFARGLYDWMGAMFGERDPSRAVKSVISQYAGPPNWLRDIESLMDPERSQTYGDDLLDELANEMQAKIPGNWGVDMPPRLTVFGEIAEPATPPWSILPVSYSKHNDIFMALNDNSVFIEVSRDPVVSVGGQDVNLMKIHDSRGENWAMHQYQKLLGHNRLKFLTAAMRESDYRKGVRGPVGSGSTNRPARGTVLTRALTMARRKTQEEMAKRYPGSDFWRAYEGKKIQAEQERPKPRHAGMREKVEERKVGFQ